jgi:imidazolonepropionase-like amidohydrolase
MNFSINVLICTLSIIVAVPAYSQSPSIILIKAGKLFDSEKGQILHNQTIIVKEGIISDIGSNIKVPTGAQIIDLSKFTVLPGLIESHSHLLMSHPGDEHNTLTVTKSITTEGDALRALRGAARAKSYLEAGYTTVRDLGNSGRFADVALKRAINEGTIVGPRLYVSGPGLSSEGGQVPDILHGQTSLIDGDYRVIRGADDARNAVREHVYFGVDLIKIYSNSSPNKTFLSVDEMKAIVEEAHFYNLKVTAHATNDLAITRAVQAGVDAIEHGYVASDSTFQQMKRNNVILVPTDMDFLMAKKQIGKLRMNLSDQEIKKLAMPYHDRLKRAKKAGIVIAAGSDMYMDLDLSRGEAAKRVLFAYQEAGISLPEILQAVTLNAARLIGEEKLGVLKKGSFADIIAVDGSPHENISTLEKVMFVMKNGIVYKYITK